MSRMRQEVSCYFSDFRKASADSNVAALNPKDSMSSLVVFRMDSSSSTTEIRFLATSEILTKSKIFRSVKESIRRWCSGSRRKGNVDSAFVYDAFSADS
jgi:hypothetical protein